MSEELKDLFIGCPGLEHVLNIICHIFHQLKPGLQTVLIGDRITFHSVFAAVLDIIGRKSVNHPEIKEDDKAQKKRQQ